jgi:hypothetical protein
MENSVDKKRYFPDFTKRWTSKIALAIVVAIASPSAAHAASILATSPSGLLWYQNAEGVLGYKLDVLDDDFLVTRLGFYDRFGDGLTFSHDIGLWAETGGAPLASATLAAGSGAPLEAGFRWVDLTTPVLLSSNTSYFLAATFVMNDLLDSSLGNAVIDPAFSVVNAAHYADGPGLLFPASHSPGVQGFFGPNLSGNAVPDPASSVFLLGAAGLGLVAIRRRLEK